MSVINVVVSRKLKVHNLSENINMCTNLGNNLCQLKVILYKETNCVDPALPVPHLALRVMGVASLKLKVGANFLKLIYSAAFNDGKKLGG